MATAADIVKAWNSVTDRWFTRRDKMHDARQWEVVHDWGGDLISDDTMRVVSRHHDADKAKAKAKQLEDIARGEAVLRILA